MPWRQSFILLVLIIASSCQGSCQAVKNQEKSLMGLNGFIEIRATEQWNHIEILHKSADIKAGDPSNNQYLLVISELKKNLKFKNQEEYSQVTRGPMTTRLAEAFVFGPEKLMIHGMAGTLYEIRGRSPNNNSVIYLHAVLESPDYYHQIVLWTHEKNMKQNRPELMKMLESFRENPGSRPPNL